MDRGLVRRAIEKRRLALRDSLTFGFFEQKGRQLFKKYNAATKPADEKAGELKMVLSEYEKKVSAPNKMWIGEIEGKVWDMKENECLEAHERCVDKAAELRRLDAGLGAWTTA